MDLEIYHSYLSVMGPDGGHPSEVKDAGAHRAVVYRSGVWWSPDGLRIAYVQDPGGDVHVVSAES